MRWAAKTDRNQPESVHQLRMMGCDVLCTHQMGEGFPDLIAAVNWLNLLIEIKDGKKPPSARKLTQQQVLFHRDWRGLKFIVKDSEEIADLINHTRAFINAVNPHYTTYMQAIAHLSSEGG